MTGQTLVEKRVARCQELRDAPVLAQDMGEEHLGLAAEGLTQVVVEVRKEQQIRHDGISWGSVAAGFGLDLGFLFRMDAGSLASYEDIGELSLGLNVQDIGTRVRWNTISQQEEELPLNLKFGIAYSFATGDHSLTAALDKDTIYDSPIHFGIEYWYRSIIALRIGMKPADFSAGFGIRKGMFSVDYAYLRQEIAGSHQLGASIRF